MSSIRCPLCRTSNVTLNNTISEYDMCPVCFEDTTSVLTCNHHLCHECFTNISRRQTEPLPLPLPTQNIDISRVNDNDINSIINMIDIYVSVRNNINYEYNNNNFNYNNLYINITNN